MVVDTRPEIGANIDWRTLCDVITISNREATRKLLPSFSRKAGAKLCRNIRNVG